MVRKLTEANVIVKKDYTVWELEVQSPWSKNKKLMSYTNEQAAWRAIDRLIENGWTVYSLSQINRRIIDNNSDYSFEPKYIK